MVCTILDRKRGSRLRGRQRLKVCRKSEHYVWCRRVERRKRRCYRADFTGILISDRALPTEGGHGLFFVA